MMPRRIRFTMALCLAVTSVASTITLPGGIAQAGLPLGPLGPVAVPEPANLSDFVQDKGAAIALGKALFWDTQVGSNGTQACATCHFHAGADNRTTNQLSPALNRHTPDLSAPDPDTSFHFGGPNYTLKATDFPFHKLADPQDRNSDVVQDNSNIAGSQGVFKNEFPKDAALLPDDPTAYDCTHVADPTFNVGGINVRRVTARNAPTVINAVFNDRNFWDGRAQNDFNGVSPFGARDQGARIWELVNGKPVTVTVSITNSSLASQAVGPPNNDVEMACHGSQWANIGHKLLSPGVVPLGKQHVAPDDSVLGSRANPVSPANPSGTGLNTSYADLIQQAFNPSFWSAKDTVPVEIPGADGPVIQQFTQMEANFSLFFGLAVQLYESTLVSDRTPVDQYLAGKATLTQQQQQGLAIFQGQGHCANCHGGPELTNASVQNVALERLERMLMGNGSAAVYDNGFYNTGVRPTFEDVGVGGLDPFGNPLSQTRYDQQLGLAAPVVAAPNEPVPSGPLQPTEPTAVDGSFKTPGLRNVELTGPYMHNGGMATLRQVVDFYNRGGDFADQNQANLDPDIVPLGLTNDQEDALVAFLLGLTDPQVKWEKAPFDHPSLCVPNGEVGDQTAVIPDSANPGQAQDRPMLCLPAVGVGGASAPLKPFLDLDPYQTLPEIHITSKPADPTNDPNPTFTFTVEAGATVQCALDASPYTACDSPQTLPAAPVDSAGNVNVVPYTFTVDTAPLTDGAHRFKVRAADSAGNVNVVPYTFTVDTVPPAVSIPGKPENLTNITNPSFTVSAEAGATLACSLTPSGGTDAFAPCRVPQSYSGLADGAYTFKVQAMDAAGNVNVVPYTFTVDTATPPLSIDAKPATVSDTTSPSFIFSSTKAGTTFKCSLSTSDGPPAAFAPCSSPQGYGPLADGTYIFQVQATDAAGNVSTSAPYTFTVDTVPPAVSSTGQPADLTNNPNPQTTVDTVAPVVRSLRGHSAKQAYHSAHKRSSNAHKRSSNSAHKQSSKTRQQAQHVLGHQRHQLHHGRVGHRAAPQSALAEDLQQQFMALWRYLRDALPHQLWMVRV